MFTTRIAWEILRVFDSATLTGGFDAVGGPLLHPSIKLKLVNNSDALVTISIDGINDIDVAPPNSFWLYDEQITTLHEAIPEGTQIYVKGTAGTGNIYLVSQYLIQL